jgi:hypothetical protein
MSTAGRAITGVPDRWQHVAKRIGPTVATRNETVLTWRRTLPLLAGALATALLGGCMQYRGNYRDVTVVARKVEIERGSYFGLAWSRGGHIVLGRPSRLQSGRHWTSVWMVRPDGTNGEPPRRQSRLRALAGAIIWSGRRSSARPVPVTR